MPFGLRADHDEVEIVFGYRLGNVGDVWDAKLVGEPLVAFMHPIRLVAIVGNDKQFKTRMCCHGTR